jgi:AcrR family transcriptional regulator
MAKSGTPGRVTTEEGSRSSGTRRALVEAAVATLKEDGFTGASARAIAARAGCNQALVFYHFGSVVGLLLAGLDAVSADRLERYRAAVEQVHSPTELVEVAATIFREDLDTGDATVLAEMIAGASSTPSLGPEVTARIAPWTRFAADAIGATLGPAGLEEIIPPDDLAFAVVALYLGLELLTHLDGDRSRALALFDHGTRLAALFEGLVGTVAPTTKGPRP